MKRVAHCDRVPSKQMRFFSYSAPILSQPPTNRSIDNNGKNNEKFAVALFPERGSLGSIVKNRAMIHERLESDAERRLVWRSRTV